jgi:hypothetical protein
MVSFTVRGNPARGIPVNRRLGAGGGRFGRADPALIRGFAVSALARTGSTRPRAPGVRSMETIGRIARLTG